MSIIGTSLLTSLNGSGGLPPGLIESFENFSGGLPVDWQKVNTPNITQSALHVTEGANSLRQRDNLGDVSGYVYRTFNLSGLQLYTLKCDVHVAGLPNGGGDARMEVAGASSMKSTLGSGTLAIDLSPYSDAQLETLQVRLGWVYGAGFRHGDYYFDNLRTELT